MLFRSCDSSLVTHVDATVGGTVVAVLGEVGGVVDGLPTREEHGIGHGGVIERRDVVTGLPAHGEDPVAGGGFIRAETHGERHLDLTVDHPGEFPLRLRDAQHSALQAAIVEPV